VTGATGFLAKAILEKILRAIPDVGKLYLLVRPGRTTRATERVTREVVNSSIFDWLRHTRRKEFAELIHERIVAVEGNLTEDHLGLSPEDYAELAGNVTCIINSGAASSFGEQLDHAIQVNTLGPSRVLQFAKDAGDIPLLHISTCYVNGTREGDISEEVLPLGHTVTTFVGGLAPVFDLDSAVSSMLAECAAIREAVIDGDRDDDVLGDAYRPLLPTDRINSMRQAFADRTVVDLGKRMAKLNGWTEAYPFTKALGEQLLVRDRQNVPLTILRPSIIESSFQEPVPGWIDGMRMADPVITEIGKGNLPEFVGRSDTTLDLIPCDMVVNATLAAMPPDGAADHCEVYQVGTGAQNPLSLRHLAKAVAEGFSRWPVRDRDGRLLEPALCKWIGAGEFKRKLYRQIRQARLMRDLDRRIGLRERARRVNQKLRVLERSKVFADLYAFYGLHSPRFLTTNTRSLYSAMTPADQALFPFDVDRIDWWDYIVDRHIPGLQRMASSKNGRKTNHREILDKIVDVPCVYDLFERTAATYGERTAAQISRQDGNRWVRYSYRQLTDAAAHIHAQLAAHGLAAGDRVVIYSESNPEWGLAYLGLQRAGMVAVPIDPRLPAGKVFDIAQHVGAKVILAGRTAYQNLATGEAQDAPVSVVQLDQPFIPSPEALPTSDGATAPPQRHQRREDTASIVFSNGTDRGLEATSVSHDSVLADVRHTLQSNDPNRRIRSIAMPQMHDDVEFSRRFVSTLAAGACVTYVDQTPI
jgi:fatty acyl-CoA reductase